MGQVVEIPYAPRPLQLAIHDALDGHRFSVAVCHRRFGKTVLAVNQLQKAALTCTKARPRFAYIAPTYRQGKAGAWDYMKHYAACIPGHKVNESELRIDFPNRGQVRIYGADNPDSLRGIYLDGAVFDEYGLQPPNIFTEVARPLLSDREGWAFFIGTPNGKNQFYELIYGDGKEWEGAINRPDWFYAEYKASQTGYVSKAELASARTAMTADEYAQEWECSFDASVKGAVYMREMLQAAEAGRITTVPYDPIMPVDTDWDLGVGDDTAIWFSQSPRGTGEIRLIDYYENRGKGLDHYKRVLDDKGYHYRDHWAPHDIRVKEMTSAHTRFDIAATMGLHFMIAPKVERVSDRINALRLFLPRCYFDRVKTMRGVEALKNYRWDYNARVMEHTEKPLHNWASHGADALGQLGYRYYNLTKDPEKQAAADLRKAQYDPDPPSYRWQKGGPRRHVNY